MIKTAAEIADEVIVTCRQKEAGLGSALKGAKKLMRKHVMGTSRKPIFKKLPKSRAEEGMSWTEKLKARGGEMASDLQDALA